MMDETNNVEQASTSQETPTTDAPAGTDQGNAKPAGLIASVRARIRRMFRKEDPNIYPFF